MKWETHLTRRGFWFNEGYFPCLVIRWGRPRFFYLSFKVGRPFRFYWNGAQA